MRRALTLCAIAVLAAAAAGAMKQIGVGAGLELETVDARFQLRGPVAPPADVVLVAVDEPTLTELQSRWPFPRAQQARLIDRLAAARPRAIAIDLQYTEPTDIDDDNALIDAIDRADRVVLATTTVDDQGSTNVLGGDDVVSDIGARVGSALMPLDGDGAIRRAAYQVEGLESFAVVTAEVATNRQVTPFDERRVWVRYAGPPGTVRAYSYAAVLHGRVAPAAFRGKVVVVGTEALRLKDASTTSTTDGSLMSGPEIQANAIATVLAGLPLRSPSPLVGAALIVLLAASAPLAAAWLRPRGVSLVSALVAVVLLVAAYTLFVAGVVIPVVHPLIAWAIGVIGVLALTRPASASAPVAGSAASVPTVAEPAVTVADTIGGCRLEEVVGRGGMGVVYRAEQPGLGRKVAVKVIAPQHAADPRFRERFAREARLAATLDHPNIVPVYTTGEDSGRLYIVMRYIDGVNVAERLRAGPLALATVADIVGDIASALDAAHAHGIVHRDVKPANILLVERLDGAPQAYLTDFGITREVDGTEGLTRPGVFIGSPDYAAPEQALGAGPLADLYSLGCVAYECLTGHPPQVRGGATPAPPSALTPSLPPAVDEVVLRAIAQEPNRRWPTCTEFAERLAGALAVMG